MMVSFVNLYVKESSMRTSLLFLFLLGTYASSAQVTQLSVQILNQDEKEKSVTYRVTNNSDKLLTCYSVAVIVTHYDGEVNEAQQSECQYDTGILASQASLERTTNAEGNGVNRSGITKVEVQPILAVFKDGSTESRDTSSWHHLMDNVKSENDGIHDVLTTLQTESDPVKAAAVLETLRRKAVPQSSYDYRLKDAITFLKKSPKPEAIKAYVDKLQKDYSTRKPYADLKPAGGVK
jgi:hypothetical protein